MAVLSLDGDCLEPPPMSIRSYVRWHHLTSKPTCIYSQSGGMSSQKTLFLLHPTKKKKINYLKAKISKYIIKSKLSTISPFCIYATLHKV